MEVSEAIQTRRAYRSLEPVNITKEIVEDLATHAGLSASCFNNQPWRYVFVYEKEKIEQMFKTVSRGNKWVQLSSLIIAVFSKPDDDCKIRDRIYHQFDVGMATAFLILRATELGLVAHPIAGFSPKKVREVLSIPDEYSVITLVIVGKKADSIHEFLSKDQVEKEKNRPPRKKLTEYTHHNVYIKNQN
jgi:nitroreductase